MSIGTGHPSRSSLDAILRVSLIAVLAAAHLSGCSEQLDPRLRERVLLIDTAALDRVLARAEQLDETPLARHARQARARIQGCAESIVHLPNLADSSSLRSDAPDADASSDRSEGAPPNETMISATGLVHQVVCVRDASSSAELIAFLRERRSGSAGVLFWPVGARGHAEFRIDVDAEGGVAIDGSLEAGDLPYALSFFVPDEESPASATINTSTALLHARMRPRNGLGLSEMMPEGGQADRLFALKGRLLEGALLSGTWELAFMPPVTDGRVPLAVAALHHRQAAPIQKALDEALTQLEAAWPIHRSPHRFQTAQGDRIEGGCFRDLPLLPEFVPCWVVTPRALLVAYRAEALDAALSAPAVSSGPTRHSLPADVGGIDIHFDRLRVVDQSLIPDSARIQLGDLWSKLTIRLGTAGEERIAVQLRLEGRS